MNIQINIESLRRYAETSEVVYQEIDSLVSVANGEEEENRQALLTLITDTNGCMVTSKDEQMQDFEEFALWSTDSDTLIRLDSGVLLCVPTNDFERLVT